MFLLILFFFLIFFKLINLFYFLFYGCVGSSFLCEGFLQLWQAGATLHRGARASHYRGLSCCRAQAPGAQAQQLWLTGPVAPRHVGSSQTRARTCVPLHWQANSQPLHHQGSLIAFLFTHVAVSIFYVQFCFFTNVTKVFSLYCKCFRNIFNGCMIFCPVIKPQFVLTILLLLDIYIVAIF